MSANVPTISFVFITPSDLIMIEVRIDMVSYGVGVNFDCLSSDQRTVVLCILTRYHTHLEHDIYIYYEGENTRDHFQHLSVDTDLRTLFQRYFFLSSNTHVLGHGFRGKRLCGFGMAGGHL